MSGQSEITTEQFEPVTGPVESTTNENVVTTWQNEVENNQSEAVTGIIKTSTIQMDVTASQPESSTDQTVENAEGGSSTATPSKQSQFEKYAILTIFGKHGFVWSKLKLIPILNKYLLLFF